MDSINNPGIQEWTVPRTGIYNITAFGAGGGNKPTIGIWGEGGSGAKVSGSVTLIKGSKLYISVGHKGNQDGNNTFGGGGKGDNNSTEGNGFSGGGGTFVSTSLIPFSNPEGVGNNTGLLFVAGGGGGASGSSASHASTSWDGDLNGGDAGYPDGLPGDSGSGGNSYRQGGLGGTQTAGGTNGGDGSGLGDPDSDGSSGNWFHGGDAGQGGGNAVQGGGGGSGYYGGGGGDNQGGGGGGGSSFINSFYVTNGTGGVRDDADAKGNGNVQISFVSSISESFTYKFYSHTFTNCGATGRYGPTLADCTSAYSDTLWTSNTNYFNMTTQGIQEWTVPISGEYEIDVYGAQGGNHVYDNATYYGGEGANIKGTFSLKKGDKYLLIVGQHGEHADKDPAGNADTDDAGSVEEEEALYGHKMMILLIAGGGGGGYRVDYANRHATTSINGYSAGTGAGPPSPNDFSNGGTNGNGATSNSGGSSYWAGGEVAY